MFIPYYASAASEVRKSMVGGHSGISALWEQVLKKEGVFLSDAENILKIMHMKSGGAEKQ